MTEPARIPPAMDYFIEKDGIRFAGVHLLVELWEARNLDDQAAVEGALTDAAEAAGATVISVHAHRFPSGGVTGIAVLAESHISIHTWPERGFAAIDVFMCGKCDPHRAIKVLSDAFAPERVLLSEHRRGVLP